MFKYKIDNDLELRQLDFSQTEHLFNLVDKNREHLRKWLPWIDKTKTVNETTDFIKGCLKQQLDNNGFQASIWYKGEIAGMVGMHGIDRSNKKTSIGYWLGEDFTGKGIMTRSCSAMISYVFDELGLNKVSINAATDNKASRAVPERLGFTNDGLDRQTEFLYDFFVDHQIYSVLKNEWKEGLSGRSCK